MMSVRSCDEEVASDSSEMMKTQGAPWRKMAVVASVCAALFLTLAVTVKRDPQKSGMMESLIDLHSAPNRSLATCTHGHSNCWGTKCCTNPHHKCYAKNQYWAQCKASCNKNFQDKYDRDRNIKTGWKCLHPYEHDSKVCTRNGKSCQRNTDCCSKDAICYVKHDGVATCNPTCKRGVGANAYDRNGKKGWSCEIHGLTYGAGKTLPEGATVKEKLDACMKHYCPKVKETSSASQKATCWSEKCSYYYDEFKHTTTTVTTTIVTTTTVTTYNKPKPTKAPTNAQ